jgi:hypothetical protein
MTYNRLQYLTITLLASLATTGVCQTIPQIAARDKALGVSYNIEESIVRDRSEINKLIEEKKSQYDKMISEGTSTSEQRDAVIKSLQGTPLVENKRGVVSFTFDTAYTLVTYREPRTSENEKWTLLMGSHSYQYGWGGGESVIIGSQIEPYSFANTLVPILPVQLRGIRAFVEINSSADTINARMLTVSLTTDQYMPCTLKFESGKLIEAQVGSIETWSYSNYKDDSFPYRMELTRFVNGKPSVERIYTRTSSKPDLRGLEKLIGRDEVTMIDARSRPLKQFEYKVGSGDPLIKAETAIVLPEFRQGLQYEAPSPLSGSRLLIGGGLIGLLVVAIVKFIKAKK